MTRFRHLAFASLVCLAALACGCGTNDTDSSSFASARPLARADFPAAFAAAWCGSAARSGLVAADESADCLATVRAQAQASLARVESGAVFDEQAAGACVDALNAQDRGTHFSAGAGRACAAVVTGIGDAGKACAPATGCPSGLSCLAADDSMDGVCAAVADPHRAAAGDGCRGAEQPHEANWGESSDLGGTAPLGLCHSLDDLRCDSTLHRCVALSRRGEPCGWDNDCAAGLLCGAVGSIPGSCHLPTETSAPFQGDVPVSPAATPSVRPSSPRAKTVAAGYQFTCAVTPAGKVKCWGTNREGELGAGLPLDGQPALPVEVAGLDDVRTISAAESFACAVTGSGSVWCWGMNSGVISLVGEGATSAVPVRIANVEDAIAVSVGSAQSCVVRATGKVSCWGAINSGSPVIDDRSVAVSSPTEVAGLTGVLSLGQGFTEPRYVSLVNSCAVVDDGTVRCWGAGYLGNGEDDLGAVAAPTVVRGIADATLVASTYQATFVVRGAGGVVAWGNNTRGLLGDGTQESRTTPAAVAGIEGAVDVAAGIEHACAVLGNGHVRCWGSNDHGQLGDGTFTSTLTPIEVEGITTATAVIAGDQHTCVLLGDGQLLCWGDNGAAQLGRGGANAYPRPVLVRGL